jgi:hypothetical protein
MTRCQKAIVYSVEFFINQIGEIHVHEGPNLGMHIIPGKHAHPMDLICAGEYCGCFVTVFRESRNIHGQIMLIF